MTPEVRLRGPQCSRLQDAGVVLLLATSTFATARPWEQTAPTPAAPSTPHGPQETQLGEQHGGIMIRHLLGDAPDPHSQCGWFGDGRGDLGARWN